MINLRRNIHNIKLIRKNNISGLIINNNLSINNNLFSGLSVNNFSTNNLSYSEVSK